MAKSLNNNKARARTIIGLADKNGKVSFFEGTIKGEVVRPEGNNNFGWDPIFKPDGKEKTFGGMTKQEKNKVSMRRKALEKLGGYIESS